MGEEANTSSAPAGKRPGGISSFFLLSFGYVAARFILGLARTRLLTEVLSKDLYGSLTLIVMSVTFACSMLSLGGYEFLVRRLPGLSPAAQQGWLRLLLVRLALPAWLVAGVVLVTGKSLGYLSLLQWSDAGLVFIAMGLTSWLFYRTFYFYGCGQLARVRLLQLFQHDLWFLAIAGVGLAAVLSFSLLLGIWTVWLGALCAAVIIVTGRVRGDIAQAGSMREAVKYGLPLLPMIAGDILFRVADRYLILIYQNMTVVAEYTLCMNIAMIAVIVGASLLDIKIPALYAERNLIADGKISEPSSGMAALFSVMLRLGLAIGIVAALVLVLFSDEVLRLLSGPAFHSSAPLLAWTAPVPILFLVSSVISRGLLTMDRSRLVGGTTLAAAVFNVLLSAYFIPRWGARGAALAITVSLFALSVVLGWELGVKRWIKRSSLKPFSLLVFAAFGAAAFHMLNILMPSEFPAVARLAAGGLLAAVALVVTGSISPADFRHTSADVAIEPLPE